MSSDQQVESIERLVEPVVQQAGSAISAVTTGIGSVMGGRMGTLQSTQYADNGSSGVSAGEVDQSVYGVWMAPFYSSTVHDQWKGNAGYKSVASGTTMGVDSMLNDSTSLGAAASYIVTDMKYRNAKSGDVTKAKSFVFSLYAMQQLNNNFFLQGQASFTKNSVKNIQKRVNSTSTEMATGKFSNSSASVDLMAGRDYIKKCTVITPLVGLGLSSVDGYDYQETGTTNQNLSVSASSSNQIMAIIGLRSHHTYDIDESLRIKPEMHMMARHYLAGRRPKFVTKLSGMVEDLVNKSADTKRTTGNVGFGVNVVSGNKEYGIGYDLDIAEKSLGHKFSLKARVNF
ncbi:MAG: autotransporter outer membrane beta-barrel domain-containing protein [Rickettsiaceae bacterium]|nr:autotransporter outer membrane beta-barrel domain-containing protein [Rickettsiaceae bacterium]